MMMLRARRPTGGTSLASDNRVRERNKESQAVESQTGCRRMRFPETVFLSSLTSWITS